MRRSSQLLIAGLLLLIGVGNVWIGVLKSSYYRRTLQESTTPTKTHPHGKHAPDSLYVKTLKSRLDYYGVVMVGGVGLTLTSVALFAVGFLVSGRDEPT